MSFDAVLYACAGTLQLLAQYNTVAMPIDDGKEEIATKTACNKIQVESGAGCRSGPEGPGFTLVEDTFKCGSHFTSK